VAVSKATRDVTDWQGERWRMLPPERCRRVEPSMLGHVSARSTATNAPFVMVRMSAGRAASFLGSIVFGKISRDAQRVQIYSRDAEGVFLERKC